MRQIFKRFMMIVCFAMIGIVTMSAEELQEVVYLKNGSVIRGTIVEQVPYQSIKIKTTDGNIFVFKLDEVEKITKEPVYQPKSNRSSYSYGATDSTPAESVQSRQYPVYDPYGWERAPRYRGSVGINWLISDKYSLGCMLLTSHGVQINPILYVGAGAGILGFIDIDGSSIPFFANARAEIHKILDRNVSPYGDIKIGYSAGDVRGVFFSPEVGCHFYFGHTKLGVGCGIGYVLQEYYGESINSISFNFAFNF